MVVHDRVEPGVGEDLGVRADVHLLDGREAVRQHDDRCGCGGVASRVEPTAQRDVAFALELDVFATHVRLPPRRCDLRASNARKRGPSRVMTIAPGGGTDAPRGLVPSALRERLSGLAELTQVHGDAVQVPMTEDHPYNNKNFYGATKVASEAMCTAFNDRYGLPVIGLRYMNVYGPGQDQTAVYTGVVPIMLNKIDANEGPVINGDGSQAYDFIYVEDVARCNVAALTSDACFGFYNVGTGVQTSIRDLCDTILRLKKSQLKVTYKPYSADDARALVQNRIGSPVKAKKELGFQYNYDLEMGLQKLIDWRDTGMFN